MIQLKNKYPRFVNVSYRCLMPNGDPRDGFFFSTLTLMIDSYILRLGQH